jgi:methylmalonyl-CoA/ethylmalonyl-CoA epimerase
MVEITEPLGPDTPVGRFLANRGQGIHHLAFEVGNLEAKIARLKEAGVRLIDETPRIGAGGHRIAFVHPAAFGGILVELMETH